MLTSDQTRSQRRGSDSLVAAETRVARVNRWRKPCMRLAYVVFLLLLSEISVRAFWSLKEGVSFFDPLDIRYVFFSELKHSGVLKIPVNRQDGHFDILILGGSVLQRGSGVVSRLEERVQQLSNRPVRIFNVANHGQSSRDSWLKYKQLVDKRFDLVVFYHAINETRLNKCAQSTFKSDYSHACWYMRLKRLEWHERFMPLAVPYTIEYAVTGLLYAPMFTERSDREGLRIKTAPSFRHNVSSIVKLAAQKGESVLLMSFAYHIPLGANRDEELKHVGGMPVTSWGSPEGVTKGIQTHNHIVREIANRNANAILVDQERQMPKDYQHFKDPCHFLETGCEVFVQNSIPAIMQVIGSSRQPVPRNERIARPRGVTDYDRR